MLRPEIHHTTHLKHKVVMTPQLQQAIEVLAMTKVELKQVIEQELEDNPLLEIEDGYETELLGEEFDLTSEYNEPTVDVDTEDSSVDIEWETVLGDRVSPSEWANTQYKEKDEPAIDVAEALSLHDYLAEQLQVAPFNETERAIGEVILGNLNEDGQLLLKLFEIPRKFEIEFDKRKLSAELRTVIEKNLHNLTGDSDIHLSGTVNVEMKTPDDAAATVHHWKIIDSKNHKTYTVVRNGNASLDFYQLTLEDIAEEVGCDTIKVEKVLRKIQDTFEPLGIAYRDVPEALLIQVRNHAASDGVGQPHPLAEVIIQNHFTELLHQRFADIADVLKVDIGEIKDAMAWISTLSPYPGRGFVYPNLGTARHVGATGAMDYAAPIIPDVEVRQVDLAPSTGSERFHVIISNRDMPRVKMNSYYVNLMRNSGASVDAESKAWIEKRYRKASDLISSIAQRDRTIVRVTEAIFKIQSKFLTEGESGIGPLTLKKIAEQVGVHESTVSRVTSNKYIQTPYGIYPFRFFFSNELTTIHGDGISARQVKQSILELIGTEEPTAPFSDQGVSDSLKSKGIRLARRTVQKYREELGIPTSRKRRKVKT